MKTAICFLVLSFAQFPARADYVSCSCCSGAVQTPEPKTTIKWKGETVPSRIRKHSHWGRNIYHAIVLPFRIIGSGIFYTVQGPRVISELIAFGCTAECYQAR